MIAAATPRPGANNGDAAQQQTGVVLRPAIWQNRRIEAAKRARKRVRVPVSEALRSRDPLLRQRPGGKAIALGGAALLAGTLAVHAAPVVIAEVLRVALPQWQPKPRDDSEQLRIRVVSQPRPVPETDAMPEAVEPAAPPATKVEQRRPILPKKPQPPKVAQPPPADPIDVAPAPAAADEAPQPAATQKRRRVVGISFESTASSGSGPALAVGNTRMGRTAETAADPQAVQKLSKQGSGLNRAATRLPVAGAALVKPRRLAPSEPEYPELMRQRGVEGDVVTVLSIDATGSVTTARVIKPSTYEALNDAALRAARQERFAPASRAGKPIPYSLKVTYRFRLND